MWKLLIELLWIATLARAQEIDFQPERCKILFAIVWHDVQAGTTVPGSADDLKWLPKDAAKNYREICYSPSATDLRFVINLNSHYTNQGTTAKTSPMTGTVTDRNYNQGTVRGTVTTTVPYSTSYEYSNLSLEGKEPGRTGWTSQTLVGKVIAVWGTESAPRIATQLGHFSKTPSSGSTRFGDAQLGMILRCAHQCLSPFHNSGVTDRLKHVRVLNLKSTGLAIGSGVWETIDHGKAGCMSCTRT